MRFLRQTLAIAGKDLRSELRGREAINSALSFAVVVLLLFSFAFQPDAEETRAMAGGLLWLVFAFTGVVILNRSFARDQPNDCLDALIASPVPIPALFLGKAFANMVLMSIVEAFCMPVFGLFYNVPWTLQFWPLLVVTALGTWGLTVVGTAFAALTANLRLRELMLPALIYPVMIPSLLAAISLSTYLAVGVALPADMWPWMKLLIGFDIIYTLLALVLTETVLVG